MRDNGRVAASAPSSSRMAKRENRLRSRTAGCCATARTWFSTGCGWPRRSWRPTARYVYVSDPESARSVEAALSELGADTLGGSRSACAWSMPGYVAGEETAAVRAINGGPAKPTDKPPRPFEEGVAGGPPWSAMSRRWPICPYLQRHGSAAFRSQGTPRVAGHLLGDDHRRRPATGALRVPAWLAISPNCLPCTGFPPTRCEAC